VTFGEVLGFSSTALIAFVGLRLGGHPTSVTGRVVALVIMVCAGTLEGASLGFFQWRALRSWLPALLASRYIGATIAVAAGGWLVGMSVPLLGALLGAAAGESSGATGPSSASLIAFSLGFGAIAGALFGTVQAAVLARHVSGKSRWIVGNMLGWGVGLPFAYFAGSLGSSAMTVWQALGLSAAAGAAMGVSVAMGTFWALRRMRAA
jgi:hypothetical protein